MKLNELYIDLFSKDNGRHEGGCLLPDCDIDIDRDLEDYIVRNQTITTIIPDLEEAFWNAYHVLLHAKILVPKGKSSLAMMVFPMKKQDHASKKEGSSDHKTIIGSHINYCKKPPLGVVPKGIWIEKRINELARAIHERTEYGNAAGFSNECILIVENWINELKENLSELGNLK